MKAWFQFPNFESKDLDFSNPKAAIEYWNSVDKKKLDKMQNKLDSEDEEYCPWGLCLISTNRLHLYRKGVMSDTFDASWTTEINEKFLGLINRTRQIEEIKEDIPSENIPEHIKIFFEKGSSPEGINPSNNHGNSKKRVKKPIYKRFSFYVVMVVIMLAMIGFQSPEEAVTEDNTSTKASDSKFPEELLGNYHGIQQGYFLKNQYGDDMIIAGKKVPMPSSDFKFLVKANNVVSLQQTTLDDNSRFYFDGKYKIISDSSELIKIECLLNDGQESRTVYILEIKKSDKAGKCIGHTSEPEFQISKK